MKQKIRSHSYKNAIAIGIASFSSIALLSTGLASFVIIRNSQEEAGGNIIVAPVSDTEIVLNITSGDSGDLTLDAEAGDYSGRVQVEQGGVGAILSHKVTGTVAVGSTKTIAANLDLTYTVNIKKLDEGTMVVANDEFITKYITPNYLSLGEFVLSSTDNSPTITAGDHAYEATFELTFELSWGSFFGGINPSLYYDTVAAGMAVSDDDVKAQLIELANAENYTFEIVIFAMNK